MTRTALHTLPSLTAAERAHSERLNSMIRDALQRAGGWLNFERFMELALYAPGLGYYSAGAHKLGAGGDFTTAPEISPFFSRCLANQCAAVLSELRTGDILELGAGSGVMAADMLLQLQALDALPERYCILEVSADLRARQRLLLQARVPHLFHKLHWLDELPIDFVGIMVANEVLDALPVQRFRIAQGLVQALGVAGDDQHFYWQAQPADEQLKQVVQGISANTGQRFAEGYCSEVNLRLTPWIHSLATCLQRGALLFIDYGLPQAQYYNAERAQGTLACFFQHRMHDNPFTHIGLQDITAWVDFTAVAEAGLQAGLELRGFATQAHFLLGAGLDRLASESADSLTDTQRWQRSQQIQKLTLPTEMGESFKVMAFGKKCDAQLSGFAFRDLRDRL
jgi:SAM-dependent MidA family methyltransferase